MALAEIEVGSRDAAVALAAPSWAGREVTEDPFFTGWSLARTTAEELRTRLAR